jgi:outer membrane protein OmpA-like peptidoglycan-associated protein
MINPINVNSSTTDPKTVMTKSRMTDFKKLSVAAMTALLLSACASTPKAPEASAAVREKLTRLQADQQLATRAPVAINEAEEAVRLAEKPTKDKALTQHLVKLADAKVDIAAEQAEARFIEDQRKGLVQEREEARLDSRTQEADNAREEARIAREQAEASQEQAQAAQQELAEMQAQIDELNAKQTDRGLVVTLGDLLFESGRAELKNNSANNLGKLSAFLNKYPDRTVIIEGHTDSVGGEDFNFSLSQRRADSVRNYLLSQGIASDRINATGKGEGSPVAGNDSSTGRQMNRRVEVIIANSATASR